MNGRPLLIYFTYNGDHTSKPISTSVVTPSYSLQLLQNDTFSANDIMLR